MVRTSWLWFVPAQWVFLVIQTEILASTIPSSQHFLHFSTLVSRRNLVEFSVRNTPGSDNKTVPNTVASVTPGSRILSTDVSTAALLLSSEKQLSTSSLSSLQANPVTTSDAQKIDLSSNTTQRIISTAGSSSGSNSNNTTFINSNSNSTNDENVSITPEFSNETVPESKSQQSAKKSDNVSKALQKKSPKNEDNIYNHGTLSFDDFQQAMDTTTLVSMATGGASLLTCALSAVVFCKLRLESSVNQFLLAINVVNLSSGLFLFFNTVVDRFFAFEYPHPAYVYVRIALLYLNVSLRRFLYVHYSYVCLLNLLAVAYPLKNFHRSLSSRPKLIIFGTFFAVFAVQVYLVLKYDSQRVGDSYRLVKSSRYAENSEAFDTALHVCEACLAFLPLVLSALFNIVLMVLLSRRRRQRADLQEGRGADVSINIRIESDRQTIVILVSSLFFTVLSLPSNSLQIIALYHPTLGLGKREYYLYKLLAATFILCQNLSRFTSFLSYVTLSATFRQQLLGMICPCRKRKLNFESVGRMNGQVSQFKTVHGSVVSSSFSSKSVSSSTALAGE
ncbi:uncharacterized protein [Littorina saxatilis]|uniref:uncharacterized protein n=1 Tax=Littorina saxatilis TaxID=31220 RepID=UPI0038B622C4